jgi:phage terminase large subunit
MLKNDPDAYEHVWEGNPRVISDAVIFKGRFVTDEVFEAPDNVRYYHGTDFGFSGDPHATIRFYITGKFPEEDLWIDREVYCYGLELDEMSQVLDGNEQSCIKYRTQGMPTLRQWPSFADCSRPETISFLARQGFPISPADKWTGCVEDGIAHLKGFRKIHIHQNCPYTAQEARLYSWKVDKNMGKILPIILDRWNHAWDGIRYGLNGVIKKRGTLGMWERLAG